MRGRRTVFGSPVRVVVLVVVAGLALGLATGGLVFGDVGQIATRAASYAEAAMVLGGPVPEIRDLPAGMTRSGIGIDPENKPVGPRNVLISYAVGGRNVALLTLWRGSLGRFDGSPTKIGDADGTVSVNRIHDGTENVGYAWERNGLSFELNVNLVSGITRDVADRMAASVR
jgi:hypothetical protein